MKPNVSTHGTFGNAIGINSKFIESDIGINAIFLVNRLSSQTILKMDIKSFKLGLGVNLSWIIFRDGTFYPSWDRYWSNYTRVSPVFEIGYVFDKDDGVSIFASYSPSFLSYRNIDFIGNEINNNQIISVGVKGPIYFKSK